MRTQWIVVGLVTVALGLSGCTSTTTTQTGVDTTAESKVEDIPGKDVKRVTLTEHAAMRLGIKTATVGALAPGAAAGTPAPSAGPGTVVPYSAVMYDADGKTWVYTVPRQFTYERE